MPSMGTGQLREGSLTALVNKNSEKAPTPPNPPLFAVSDFSRVVYRSRRGESLFTRRAILSMCALEARQLKSVPGYTDLCESKVTTTVMFWHPQLTSMLGIKNYSESLSLFCPLPGALWALVFIIKFINKQFLVLEVGTRWFPSFCHLHNYFHLELEENILVLFTPENNWLLLHLAFWFRWELWWWAMHVQFVHASFLKDFRWAIQ